MRSQSVVTGSEDWDWPLRPYAGMRLPEDPLNRLGPAFGARAQPPPAAQPVE